MLRRGKPWKQAELAERMTDLGVEGIHQQTVQRIESGMRPVRLSEAITLCKVFNCSVSDLTEFTEPAATSVALRKGIDMAISELKKLRKGIG